MYRFVEHTAELEVELEAESAEEALEDGLRALAELLGPAKGEELERTVELEARDLSALLALWLEELVFLADTDGLVPERADVVVEGSRLRAVVHGRRGAPRPLVKAVTLHRLRFGPENGRWRGRVVLDV
jgi:SHS2 domain-containing protein